MLLHPARHKRTRLLLFVLLLIVLNTPRTLLIVTELLPTRSRLEPGECGSVLWSAADGAALLHGLAPLLLFLSHGAVLRWLSHAAARAQRHCCSGWPVCRGARKWQGGANDAALDAESLRRSEALLAGAARFDDSAQPPPLPPHGSSRAALDAALQRLGIYACSWNMGRKYKV